MNNTITLDNGLLRAVITPESGASMLAFFAKRGDAWLPIMPDARDDACDLTWCNWLMIPYSNRVENGRFTWDGKEYQLDNGKNNAIHGDTRTRPWCVEDQSDSYLRCDFQSAAHEHFNWPWPIEARVEYELMESVFSMRIWLWNRGDTPMPAGFGFHPYFSRHLTTEGESALVKMLVHGIYPDANDNRIPSGPAQPPKPELDFSSEAPIPPALDFDFCGYGYDGKGTIRWPESGVSLRFDCTPTLAHLVVYNPIDKPYFAVEPVANANNGVNLLTQGDPTAGTIPLAPGECLEARFDIAIEVETP